MWTQPDSAFAFLLAFAESPEADSLDEFNRHYFQLLASELLYKNDYEMFKISIVTASTTR